MDRSELHPRQETSGNAAKFLRKVLAALQSGTRKGMMELNGHMLPMHLRIWPKKIRQIRKTMAEPEVNLCRQALLAGKTHAMGRIY